MDDIKSRMYKLGLVSTAILSLLAGCGGSDGGDNSATQAASNILGSTVYAACINNTRTSYDFKPNFQASITTQHFSDNNCTTATDSPTSTTFSYTFGTEITANDGLTATQFNMTSGGITVYSLIRLSDGLIGTEHLNFGAEANSSAGLDGSLPTKRYDGLDLTRTFTLQP